MDIPHERGDLGDERQRAERSYVVTVESGHFAVAWVQCDVSGDQAWVRRHHSFRDRHPMRVAVTVSVPSELWGPDGNAASDRGCRRGRLIEDHGRTVTLWATPDDLEDLLDRWPAAAEGLNASHNDQLKRRAAEALRLRQELEAAWMGEAARAVSV